MGTHSGASYIYTLMNHAITRPISGLGGSWLDRTRVLEEQLTDEKS